MKPGESRRDLLNRVRRGELGVADAVALLSDGGSGATPADHVTLFQPGWMSAERTLEPAPLSAYALITVLDESVADLDTTGSGVVVRATPGAQLHRSGQDSFRVGIADDVAWERLWSELITEGRTPDRIVFITSADPEHCLDAVYPLIRTVIRNRVGDGLAVACIAIGGDRGQTADALGGFCQIAGLEDRRLRLLAISAKQHDRSDLAALVNLGLAELAVPQPGLAEIRYDSGGRSVRALRPIDTPRAEVRLRPSGVFLLAGGAGGIGLQVAEQLAVHTQARMVLLGRSAWAPKNDQARVRIEQAGGQVRYVRGDVTRLDDVAAAADLARNEFGSLAGVLHLAGVNEDTYIVNKALGAHQRVLAPKVTGARNLDLVTKNDALDIFVVFSSLAAYLGAPGQSDYASAGRALGGFAERRAADVAAGRRSGTTVSIGWPLWAEGGMTLSERDTQATELLQGITAMPTSVGFQAMLAALETRSPEILVAHGDGARTRDYVGKRVADRPVPAGQPETHDAVDGIVSAAERYLLGVVSEVTRIPAEQLQPDQEFSAIGVDSVLIKRLTVVLEERLGPLPVTLLFEQRTVRELTQYLLTHFAEPMQAVVGSTVRPITVSEPEKDVAGHVAEPTDGIAIIGIAGRYPGARDLDELWAMLLAGKSAITEVPAERWDNDRYFEPEERRPGAIYGRWGGFLQDVRRFDSLFFAVAPREAERMDPAERLFLEVAWSAIEDAGYSRNRLHRTTWQDDGHAIGVYVGTTGLSYQLVGAEEWGKGNPVSAHSMDFSLANRLSYFLDAHGPSIVVDTACSASLTALHLACDALRNGDCQVAIAGGAYLSLHPSKFAMLSEQRMISRDGVIRAFGDGANGFVPGEGVGAVVLKPLAAALADGDHVHAVIRGTSIKHGGKTNGYTVPNPQGHAAVIRTALSRASIDPRSIGYVEAHGTGTELGDPIEFDGLSRVFREHTADKGFCALGSVKTNIGHAEAAAGIAGLTKVVLQLRHGMLAPTLNSDSPNPRIDFQNSPFQLQHRAEPWRPPADGGTRRAAISSFGAGGANAHVIVEEHLGSSVARESSTDHEQLIVLSARTYDRLDAVVDRLVDWLAAPKATLREVAYTLQVGRDDLEYRLAVTARSLEELREKLLKCRRGADDHIQTSRVDDSARPAVASERVSYLIKERRWDELAALWQAGAAIDWEGAYQSNRPSTVSLPTYPFSGPEHWPNTIAPSEPRKARPNVMPDYLVRHSETDFAVQLDPADPVVADHVIAGRRIVAGVAQLEFARAAVAAYSHSDITVLADARWRSPIDAGSHAVSVRLSPRDGHTVAEFVSGRTGAEIVHSTISVKAEELEAPAPLDIAGIRGRCTASTPGEQLYTRAESQGLHYGPSFRRVQRVWSGTHEALAELGGLDEHQNRWLLNPGLTDAALHTIHGALPENADAINVPASVARVELHGSTEQASYAYAQLVDFDAAGGTARLDVSVCDTEGRVLVRFKGLRVVRRADELPYFRSVWQVRPALDQQERQQDEPVLIMATGHDHGLGDALEARHGSHSRRVPPDTRDRYGEVPVPSTIYFLGGMEDRKYSPSDMDYLEWSQRTGCVALFHLAQMLAAQRARGVRLVVISSDAQQIDDAVSADNPFAASLHGLARAISRELTFLDVVCVDVAGGELARRAATGQWSDLLDQLGSEPAQSPMAEVALREGIRLEKCLVPASLPEPAATQLPFRKGGRYLMVGGAGGLGRAVTEYLAREYDAKLMLVGRRPERELPAGLLAGMRSAGGEIGYFEGDVTDVDSMRSAVARMRSQFGGVDGVVHSAFVLADRTVAQMDDATFLAALAPKVRGTVALCEAVGSEELDFFALFSSAIAHTGNPGQANYAAGSTFQDAFGRYAASRLHQPITIFNWGFWGDRGAVATDDYRERLARAGVRPISDTEGVQAFRTVLGNAVRQTTPLRAAQTLAEATAVDPQAVHEATPVVASVLGEVHGALNADLAGTGEPYSPDYLDAVDAFGRKLILDAMRSMGVLRMVGERHGVSELKTTLGVSPRQYRLFDALVSALDTGGYIRRSGDHIEVLPQGNQDKNGDLHTLRASLTSRFPHLRPTLDLLTECAAALPDVLAGARRGLEVLFPGGSHERMSGLYHDDPRVKHFNALCTKAVRTAATAGVTGASASSLRILEIGAGTGGTSKPVLAALDPYGHRLRYDYTDISPALVGHARERFGQGRSFVDFRLLDIGGDLLDQGFDDDRYDIVLATNVLHATPDIRRTLRNIAHLMKSGAVLVVNEATRVLDSITLLFGLTDGWWLAEDSELRLTDSPLLGTGQWKALLNEAGLHDVRAYGVATWSEEQAGQHVLVAERDRWRPRMHARKPQPVSELAAVPQPTPEGLAEVETRQESMHTHTVNYLTTLCSELLKVPVDELEPDTSLASYGVDSLITMELQERLERDLGLVPADAVHGGSITAIADELLAARNVELATFLGQSDPPEQPKVLAEQGMPSEGQRPEPIAIIGVAGRYPSASDLDTLWANLLAGHCSVGEDKPSRMAGSAGHGFHRWGAYLDDIECFDPLLFRISPSEAERMDPSERIFLQTAWEALEDAGQPPSRLRADAPSGRAQVGVFVGAMHAQYEVLAIQETLQGNQARALSARWSIANRVSHCFGFAGPSMAIDTACSSALTAAHLAVESLRRHECTAALVGGVNLILHPSHDQALMASKMLSGDGQSRAFAPDAAGMVTGEGVGAIVLKRLSDAVRDGDRIHACIIGSQINADGGMDAYAVPNQVAQEDLIAGALRIAGVDAEAIHYVEAHATGSPVGDPVEVGALGRVFGTGQPAVGSLKPNLGHLEAASGMAQLTKVLLQLRHETFAPTIGSGQPNATAFEVVREPRPWPAGRADTPRRAAVSSFGAGGANAHLIIEEAPPRTHSHNDRGDGPWVFVVSARRPERLRTYAAKMRDFLSGPGAALSIADVTYTLQVGREPLRARLAWLVRSVPEAVELLNAYLTENRNDDPATEPTIQAAAARDWRAGADVDWNALHVGTDSRIVSLPHYPFAQDRYWLPVTEPVSGTLSDHEEMIVTQPNVEAGTVRSSGIRDQVIATIADVIGVQPADIDEDDRLSDFGFDSVTMVTLADRLSSLLGADVNPAVLYGYADVTALITDLSARTVQATGGTPTDQPAKPPYPLAVPQSPLAASPASPTSGKPAVTPGRTEPIAVVGMAGAFPGSPDVDAFWEHLIAGHDLIEEVPAGRFEDHHQGETRARWGGFLSDIDKFDAAFFQITPREARLMDPHHRLFLQTVWAAIEEAGYDPTQLAGAACGVYVGVASSEYAQLARVRGVEIDGQLATGNDHSMVANRVSFLLDLHGPSEPVDTACSSSLVAIDRAVRAIQAGDCEMAIAGGVNVILTPDAFDAFGSSGMLAPDGRCKAFDHRADGYVRGEGVGALLLKPLSRAVADGDHIHALFTGTATNHGGRANSLTAPNPAAQAAVIEKAHARAGISPAAVGYVEAHGTGTALGDPIEITGLRTAFGELAAGSDQYCGLGSVKTNVGHLETAAGIAGVIKVIMSLRHRLLPPTLHVEQVNPLIELSGSQFYLVTSPRPWERPHAPDGAEAPRRAGVSSFGYGGMNAHVIVEEPPAACVRPPATGPQLFVLSARDDDRLHAQATQLVDYVNRLEISGSISSVSPSDVAYTLQIGRPALASRLAIVAETLPELATALRAYLADSVDSTSVTIADSRRSKAEALDAEEIEHLLSRARTGNLKGLAKAWGTGTQIDWTQLHDGERRRVSLPTYPFSKDRHWLPAPKPTPPAVAPQRTKPAVVAALPVSLPKASPVPVPQANSPAHRSGHSAQVSTSTSLHRHVREAVAEGIGVTVEEVDPTRDFAAYGVDSIGALRIMQHIQSRYGDHIPMAAILEHANVDLLVAHLAENYVLPDTPPGPLGDPAESTAAPVQLSSPRLVPFSEATDGIPAYCFFGDTGELSWLLHLSEGLAASGQVFGLEAPGFGDGDEPSGDIEDLADRCADVILVHHTEGACRVVGYGLAGFVAAEAARTLMHRGVEVAELLLIGTPEPSLDPRSEEAVTSVTTVANVFAAAWGATQPVELKESSADDIERNVAAAAQQLAHVAPMDARALQRWLEMAARWRVCLLRGTMAYRPRPITGAGAVTVVRTAERVPGIEPGDFDRWIAPPPVIHELNRPLWTIVAADPAQEVIRVLAQRPGAAAAARSSLVPINRFGSGPRSFWAHNLYGEVSYAIYLSKHLGLGKPVIGLEQIDVGSHVQEYDSVDEMAARYTAELREQHQGEPFILGGCSFGGVLAYEIARQLQAQGEQVSRLIAIDPIMPGTAAWDSVDWGQVTELEAESFSIVMLGNASCQRWGVAERINLDDLANKSMEEQLDVVARHIIDRSPARPDSKAIRRQIRIRHDLMMRNNVLLQAYRPARLIEPIPTTLFHATRGFLAADNDNDLPAIPRSNADRSNGFAEFVGDRLVIHELEADHFTIAYDHNLTRIAKLVAPLLDGTGFPADMNSR